MFLLLYGKSLILTHNKLLLVKVKRLLSLLLYFLDTIKQNKILLLNNVRKSLATNVIEDSSYLNNSFGIT